VVSSKADQLNAYYFATGKPDYFAADLDRYRKVQPADVQAAVQRWLPADKRLELTVVPAEKK
jgi:predicted Zn-dependent peptidase